MKKIIFLSLMVLVLTLSAVSIVNAAEYSGTCGMNANWSLDTSTGVLSITGKGDMENHRGWFDYKNSIKSIEISYGITSVDDFAFTGCGALTSINIPSSVITIGDSAFYGCKRLTGISIPSGVITIGDSAFSGCTGLTGISIPSSVRTIGVYAFYNCSGLASINVCSDNTKYDSRSNCNAIIETSTGELITGCKNTFIPESVIKIGDSAFYGCSGLSDISIPTSVTTIGHSAFYGCSGLTRINIPSSVTTIGEYAFAYCTGLISTNLSDGVTSIERGTFHGCKELVTITIPSKVKSIGDYAFSDCSSIITITIPSGVNSIGHYAFLNCSSLTDIIIPNSVTTIGDSAFYGCKELTYISIPISVSTIGDKVFADCSGLISINVNKDNTKYDSRNNCNAIIETKTNRMISGCKNTIIDDNVTTIGDSAFRGCSDLTTIMIPSSVTTIGSYAFADCGLTTIMIPSSVTTIGSYAFADCGLTAITIPSSVTTIGQGAFHGCDDLAKVYYSGTSTQWNAISIDEYNNSLENNVIFDATPVFFSMIWDESNYDVGDTATATVQVIGTSGSSFAGYSLKFDNIPGMTLTGITPITQTDISGNIDKNVANSKVAFSVNGTDEIDISDKSYDIIKLTYTVDENAVDGCATLDTTEIVVRHNDNSNLEYVEYVAGKTKLHNIIVTLQNDVSNKATITGQKVFYAKYNEPGLYTDWQRTEAASEDDFMYITEIGYSLSTPAFMDENSNTEADFSSLLSKTWTESNTYSLIAGQQYGLTIDTDVLSVASGAEEKAGAYVVEKNADLNVKHVPQIGKLLVGVFATVGGENIPVTHNADGSYTIAGSDITGDVIVTADVIDATISFVSLSEYLDDTNADTKLVKVSVYEAFSDSHLALGDYNLYWSPKYSAYVGFADKNATQQSIVNSLIRVSGSNSVIVYNGDVTADSEIDIGDALIINARLFNLNWTGGITEENLLRMDLNGDGVVNVADIQLTLRAIAGYSIE